MDKWLVHYLCHADLTAFITGLTVPKLNQEMLRSIPIPLPSLPEQQRIVAIMEEAFAAIATATANTEKNLTSAGEVFEAALQEVFFGAHEEQWEQLSFDACLLPVRYTNKIPRREFKTEGRFPIVSQEAEFINGYWDEERDVLHIDKPLIIFGDHTRVLKFIDFNFVLGADGVKLLMPNERLDPKFFYYALSAKPLKQIGYARHYRKLRELTISFPSLPRQRQLVSILDSVNSEIKALEATYDRKIAALTELKKSLLARAFAGELTSAAVLAP
jgi:type I restriction enzyme S subunit